MNKIALIFIIIFLLNSCGGLKEAGKVLRNEKIRTTDEFLVKKKKILLSYHLIIMNYQNQVQLKKVRWKKMKK